MDMDNRVGFNFIQYKKIKMINFLLSSFSSLHSHQTRASSIPLAQRYATLANRQAKRAHTHARAHALTFPGWPLQPMNARTTAHSRALPILISIDIT